jgi:RmuC family
MQRLHLYKVFHPTGSVRINRALSEVGFLKIVVYFIK